MKGHWHNFLPLIFFKSSLSAYLGVTTPIESLSSVTGIANIIETIDLPEAFTAQVEIQRHVARYMATLTSSQEYSFNTAAIKIFERELDSISLRYKITWNTEAEFSLLKAKLSLYALSCIGSHVPDHSAILSTRQANNYHDLDMSELAGLYFASKLISIYSDMADTKATTTLTYSPADLRPDNVAAPCIPKYYTRSMTFATLFLLKFCAFNRRLSQNDRDTAENSIKIAYGTLLRASTHPLDEYGRTAKFFEVLSKSGESNLRIKDRHDASIIYDSLHRAAELRGRRTDEPIPEIHLQEEHTTSDNDLGDVSVGITDLNSALDGFADLDPWISYLGLPGEPWHFGDLDI